ncbi:TPA: hypothetical protein HGR93_18400, partial [Escherichia coli]|nr:hypothetical protein [Escherichia coli]HAG8141836.1 hypothetical protein [Escherichia coli]
EHDHIWNTCAINHTLPRLFCLHIHTMALFWFSQTLFREYTDDKYKCIQWMMNENIVELYI